MPTIPRPVRPATPPKSRPINLRPWEVRAFLDGPKSQIRRPVNLSRVTHNVTWVGWDDDSDLGLGWYARDIDSGQFEPAECWASTKIRCPFGREGDRLYGREMFSLVPCSAGCEKYPDGFDPTIASVHQPHAPHEGVRYKATWSKSHSARWKQANHLPRWAARLHFTLAAIRVERVQAISEADALAEGVEASTLVTQNDGSQAYRLPFMTRWRADYGIDNPNAWESDPFVWCLTLERISP